MIEEIEVWKDVPGYEGLYQASNLGRIKALKKIRTFGLYSENIRIYPEKIMRQRKLPKKKYLYVIFSKEGFPKSFTVHRLIANIFVPNPDNLPVVNHLDFDTFNNRATNFEWTTCKGNSQHSLKNGRMTSLFGNDDIENPSSRKVIDSITGKVYESISEASKESNFSIRSLYHQLQGDQVKKTTLNYYK